MELLVAIGVPQAINSSLNGLLSLWYAGHLTNVHYGGMNPAENRSSLLSLRYMSMLQAGYLQ